MSFTEGVFPGGFQKRYLNSSAFRVVLPRYREAEQGWGRYNSHSSRYNELFRTVLAPETLFTLAEEIKSRKGGLIGMDLCGQGDFLAELGATKGISVCLRHYFKRCALPSDVLDKVDANLLENQTWDILDQWVSLNGNPDLIVCAPGGAVEALLDWGAFDDDTGRFKHSRATFFWLLKKMTALLSQDGTLLFELQRGNTRYWLSNTRIFNHLPGDIAVSVNAAVGVLRVTKIPKSTNPDIVERKSVRVLRASNL
ncbi:hypothetical protein COT62_02470 [Candidatus Roizmanbacteria bacterium CG09_land_8_20_14_0_10_41_9]|uniref:Uncharacterized protein n=1 Tax=Candidatus Roizmanbacteria bacterium CG09_land_8_20_14_0_10_41_9 TaxID=1974850 RepID=A0A2H0WST7_9BACT|nr:MAG: hypothetical protein COT62_02470 [Candidatus Roizmanbacteria bacterium CG09_land_8_20_14_0_10_41_9]